MVKQRGVKKKRKGSGNNAVKLNPQQKAAEHQHSSWYSCCGLNLMQTYFFSMNVRLFTDLKGENDFIRGIRIMPPSCLCSLLSVLVWFHAGSPILFPEVIIVSGEGAPTPCDLWVMSWHPPARVQLFSLRKWFFTPRSKSEKGNAWTLIKN